MFIEAPEDSASTTRLFKANEDSLGFVMNLTRAWAWRPDVSEAFAAVRSQLMASSTLSKREQAVMVCATAAALGDSYCSLAWGRTLAEEAGAPAAAAVIECSSYEGLNARDRALAAWARKVVADPTATSAQDLVALRAAGFSEKEVFEATVFIAFRLAFSSVNDALGIRPDWQLAETVPPEVRSAVTFGRPVAKRPAQPADAPHGTSLPAPKEGR